MAGCTKCEELLQVYVDGQLSNEEAAELEVHLDRCGYCRKRYRFERKLRTYIRKVSREPMPSELQAKLAQLRAHPHG
jgi:anti-sigma factor (TIGR02949 family)